MHCDDVYRVLSCQRIFCFPPRSLINPHQRSAGMVDLFRRIRSEAGWTGLWRGVGPALARISIVRPKAYGVSQSALMMPSDHALTRLTPLFPVADSLLHVHRDPASTSRHKLNSSHSSVSACTSKARLLRLRFHHMHYSPLDFYRGEIASSADTHRQHSACNGRSLTSPWNALFPLCSQCERREHVLPDLRGEDPRGGQQRVAVPRPPPRSVHHLAHGGRARPIRRPAAVGREGLAV